MNLTQLNKNIKLNLSWQAVKKISNPQNNLSQSLKFNPIPLPQTNTFDNLIVREIQSKECLLIFISVEDLHLN